MDERLEDEHLFGHSWVVTNHFSEAEMPQAMGRPLSTIHMEKKKEAKGVEDSGAKDPD